MLLLWLALVYRSNVRQSGPGGAVTVYLQCVRANLRDSGSGALPVYRCGRAPFGPGAQYRCIGVSARACVVRGAGRGPVYRCIGAGVRRSGPGARYRCIGVSVRTCAVRGPGRGTGVSVYRCERAPFGAQDAVPVYRCIGARLFLGRCLRPLCHIQRNSFGTISRQRLFSIRWNFAWGKTPENRDIQCIPIHFLIGRGPRAPMTRECIPILFLLLSRSPKNPAPSMSYSGRGGGPPPNKTSARIRVQGLNNGVQTLPHLELDPRSSHHYIALIHTTWHLEL